MAWNTNLFLLLNAATDPGPALRAAVVLLASGPVLLAPVLLVCLWVWGNPNRRPALLAVSGGLSVGQALNVFLGLAWYEPRPFMLGIGHTWLAHAADNGFPSDHATLAWSLGVGLILTRTARAWGIASCLLGIAAGWARVYLGVHFPIDVLVSAPVGFIAGQVASLAEPALRRWIAPPAERLYEAILSHLPDSLPLPRRTRS